MVSDIDGLFADLCEVIPELLQGMNRPGLPSGTPFTGSYCHGQTFNPQKKVINTQPSPYDRPYQSQFPMQWIKPAADYLNQENVDSAKSITNASHNGYFQSGRINQGTLWKQSQHISSESKVTKFCMCSCTSGIPQCTCDVKCSVSSEPNSLQFLIEPACIQSTQSESNNLHQSFTGPSSCEYPYFLEYPENTRCQQESAPRGTSNSIPSHPANVLVKPTSFPTYDQIQNNSASQPYDSSQFNINTSGFNQSSKVEYSLPRPRQSSQMNPPKPRRKRPRLCHFLLELLANPQQYSNIVEWVDQENGVFKFLNSSEVASQWGRRRDKPNMKYENFARSLRTYIAKGIMTKPRSKLVYKFTNKVL